MGFPDRSRISRVEKRERISRGKDLSPVGILSFLVPL